MSEKKVTKKKVVKKKPLTAEEKAKIAADKKAKAAHDRKLKAVEKANAKFKEKSTKLLNDVDADFQALCKKHKIAATMQFANADLGVIADAASDKLMGHEGIGLVAHSRYRR